MKRAPTVLICWEMGGGLGHLGHLGLLTRALIDRGCRPVGVFRDFQHIHKLIPPSEVLAAPIGRTSRILTPTYTYSHILHNCGFENLEDLRTRIRSWHTIFALVKPDLLVCEHSPTALLAALCLGLPACTFGTGFFDPPDVWPPLPLVPNGLPEELDRVEDSVRNLFNRVLGEFGRPPVSRITELYSRAQEHFLVTFSELDHFAESRASAKYCGAWPYTGGVDPKWQSGFGAKLYIYLKPCRVLCPLITLLSRLANPLIVYAPEVQRDLLKPLQRRNITISQHPVGMWRVARECDKALLHGTHGTMAAMFLAGKPCFHVPLFLEQQILATRLVSRGAAMAIDQSQEAELEETFTAFLENKQCATNAAHFADKYRGFDLPQQVALVAQQVHEMAI